MRSRLVSIFVAVLVLTCGSPILATDFPTKQIQIIVPWAREGATDVTFRALAAPTAKYLGKAIIVVNRPGGGGVVGYTEAAQATPDGHTLVSAITALTTLPHEGKAIFSYKSFDPIINITTDPLMFLTKPDAPWKDLKEFISYVKQNPNIVTVGNSGAGGSVHLAARAFEKVAGVKFNHIPFFGGGPSVAALIGDNVKVICVSPPEGIPELEARKLKILALFADKRLAMFPDVPTVKEQGINFAMAMWRGLAAPKGTPPDVLKKLHDAFKQGMEDAAFKKSAADMAVSIHYLGPEEFGKLMASEDNLYADLVNNLKK